MGLDYRDGSLVLCCPRNQKSHQSDNYNIPIKIGCIKVKKSTYLNWTYGNSGNKYRVATLSKSYITTTGITMQSLKSIGQF